MYLTRFMLPETLRRWRWSGAAALPLVLYVSPLWCVAAAATFFDGAHRPEFLLSTSSRFRRSSPRSLVSLAACVRGGARARGDHGTPAEGALGPTQAVARVGGRTVIPDDQARILQKHPRMDTVDVRARNAAATANTAAAGVRAHGGVDSARGATARASRPRARVDPEGVAARRRLRRTKTPSPPRSPPNRTPAPWAPWALSPRPGSAPGSALFPGVGRSPRRGTIPRARLLWRTFAGPRFSPARGSARSARNADAAPRNARRAPTRRWEASARLRAGVAVARLFRREDTSDVTFADFSAAGFLASRAAGRGAVFDTTRARRRARADRRVVARTRRRKTRRRRPRRTWWTRSLVARRRRRRRRPSSVPNPSDGPRSFACFWSGLALASIPPARTGARTARRCLGGRARHPLRRPTDARIGGERGGFRQVFDARPGGARGGARRARRALGGNGTYVLPAPGVGEGAAVEDLIVSSVDANRVGSTPFGHVIVGAGVLWTGAATYLLLSRSVGSSRDVTRTTSARDSSPRVRTRPRRRYSTSRTLTCDTRRFRGFERGREPRPTQVPRAPVGGNRRRARALAVAGLSRGNRRRAHIHLAVPGRGRGASHGVGARRRALDRADGADDRRVEVRGAAGGRQALARDEKWKMTVDGERDPAVSSAMTDLADAVARRNRVAWPRVFGVRCREWVAHAAAAYTLFLVAAFIAVVAAEIAGGPSRARARTNSKSSSRSTSRTRTSSVSDSSIASNRSRITSRASRLASTTRACLCPRSTKRLAEETLEAVRDMAGCMDCAAPEGETRLRPWYADVAVEATYDAARQAYYRRVDAWAVACPGSGESTGVVRRSGSGGADGKGRVRQPRKPVPEQPTAAGVGIDRGGVRGGRAGEARGARRRRLSCDRCSGAAPRRAKDETKCRARRAAHECCITHAVPCFRVSCSPRGRLASR